MLSPSAKQSANGPRNAFAAIRKCGDSLPVESRLHHVRYGHLTLAVALDITERKPIENIRDFASQFCLCHRDDSRMLSVEITRYVSQASIPGLYEERWPNKSTTSINSIVYPRVSG